MAFIVEEYYSKYEMFKEESILEPFIDEVNQFIEGYYNESTLSTGAAYQSDKKPARISYAFNLVHSSSPAQDLPSIRVHREMFPIINIVSDRMFELMNISEDSRILFNIQKYFSDNEEVTRHFDGHYFDFHHDTDGRLIVTEALRPKEVAVLTLLNDVPGAGTRIWEPCKEDGTVPTKVVECKGGDLLVFDNWKCFHGADAFKAKSTRPDNLVRMTVGWRSIEDNCQYIVPDDRTGKEVSLELAQHLHREWLKTWPAKWAEIKKLNKQAAF
jgi:hypothetical protein